MLSLDEDQIAFAECVAAAVFHARTEDECVYVHQKYCSCVSGEVDDCDCNPLVISPDDHRDIDDIIEEAVIHNLPH